MTSEQAKELLPIIKAFAEGKEIQFRASDTNLWIDSTNLSFEYDPRQYRIKPEPRIPRVFYVGIHPEGALVYCIEKNLEELKDYCESEEIIKVQEVIEDGEQ